MNIIHTRVKKLNHFLRIHVSSQMPRTHLISLADILVNTHRLHIQLHQRYCNMHSRCSYQCVCIARALCALYAGNIVPVDHGISCRWMARRPKNFCVRRVSIDFLRKCKRCMILRLQRAILSIRSKWYIGVFQICHLHFALLCVYICII